MKLSKIQIIIILVVNLYMFSMGIFGVIKWMGVSNIRLMASGIGAAIFLFFIVSLLVQHYRLLIK